MPTQKKKQITHQLLCLCNVFFRIYLSLLKATSWDFNYIYIAYTLQLFLLRHYFCIAIHQIGCLCYIFKNFSALHFKVIILGQILNLADVLIKIYFLSPSVYKLRMENVSA